MPTITVLRPNRDEHTISLKTLASWLADSSTFTEIVGDLVEHGSVFAEIKQREDEQASETATLTFVPTPARGTPADPPEQPELPIRAAHNHAPQTEFDAEAQILLQIPARITCRAHSPSWARKLIEDVLHGGEPAPRGFAVEIDTDFAGHFFAGCGIANSSRYPLSTLGVQDIVITAISPRLLLEGRVG
jgi:hypothetical protein